MIQIIDRVRYDTEKAKRICSSFLHNCNPIDKNGRAWTLYKSFKGNFFTHHETIHEDEVNRITPVSFEDALDIWEEAITHYESYKDTFGIEPEDA